MLVLSRKLGESITIDGQITIKVLDIRGNRIRLGFEAPQFCEIRRSEWQPDQHLDDESETFVALSAQPMYPR